MGADFCWQAVALPMDSDGKMIPEFTETMEGALVERMLLLSDDQWAEVWEQYVDLGPLMNELMEHEPTSTTGRNKIAHAVVSDLRDVQEFSRETALVHGLFGENRMYVMTGGMTWGDSPTEAFDVICRLNAASAAWAEPL